VPRAGIGYAPENSADTGVVLGLSNLLGNLNAAIAYAASGS
jgi:hypothetical protein